MTESTRTGGVAIRGTPAQSHAMKRARGKHRLRQAHVDNVPEGRRLSLMVKGETLFPDAVLLDRIKLCRCL